MLAGFTRVSWCCPHVTRHSARESTAHTPYMEPQTLNPPPPNIKPDSGRILVPWSVVVVGALRKSDYNIVILHDSRKYDLESMKKTLVWGSVKPILGHPFRQEDRGISRLQCRGL